MRHVDAREHFLSVITCAQYPTEEARTTITVMGVERHEAKDNSREESIKNKEKTLQGCEVLEMVDAKGACVRASILVD